MKQWELGKRNWWNVARERGEGEGRGEKERTRVIQGVKSELDIVPVKSGRFGPGRVLHISASVGCSPVYNA